MKKILQLFCVLCLTGLVCSSCEYDDQELRNSINDLTGRVEALEKASKDANDNIKSLQQLLDAIDKRVVVTAVEKQENGYTLSFSDGKQVNITHGVSPRIGVKQAEDGVYYWVVNDEFLQAGGKKIKAEGRDGATGAAGVTPKLRINPKNKDWEVSTDEGKSWQSLGVKAGTGEGEPLFTSVDTITKKGWVVLTLSNKEQIELPLKSGFSLTVSAKEAAFTPGEKKEFTVRAEGLERMMFTKPDGWRVSLKDGVLSITAPVKENAYAETEGTVTLMGLSGHFTCLAEVAVSVREKQTHTVTFEGEEWKSVVMANYRPGKFSTTSFQKDHSYTWEDKVTHLTTGRPKGFVSGWGYPWFVSSYNSSSLDKSKYGGFLYDLYVYNPNGSEDSQTGGGNNGSDNFLTTFGYNDLEHSYGDGRPILKFADGQPRVIKSLYVAPTCYFYAVAASGNQLSPALSEPVTYYATGYDAEGQEIKTITMTFATKENLPKGWKKWDLSELGPIVSLRLNQAGGADNGYGYSLPAYWAVDDITVEW